MHVILIIFLVLVVILTLVLILALFMKKEYSIKSEIVINAPRQKIFDFLKHLKNQDKFNKWAKADPNRVWEYRGIDGTVGFIIAWKGNKDAGEGEKEIINLIDGEIIETEIRFVKPMRITSRINLETTSISNTQTRVAMINSGSMKWPMNLFIPMGEKNFPKDMDSSLATLKGILENNS
jgi:hypothetical protein